MNEFDSTKWRRRSRGVARSPIWTVTHSLTVPATLASMTSPTWPCPPVPSDASLTPIPSGNECSVIIGHKKHLPSHLKQELGKHILPGVRQCCSSNFSILSLLTFLLIQDLVIIFSWKIVTLSFHRLFPLKETSLFRGEAQQMENVLVTSSCDHSIRLWWKGLCQRCFRGHNGPVTALSDKLLGEDSDKVLGSGGEDGTVRLWSLGSSGKRGRHALKATLYGHEKPVKLMSVARHKTSLLVTISKDSKVRVWDTSTSSAVRSSCCVGMTSVTGAPVDMKCHESLLYVAAGSSVVTVDLRTMQKVVTAAVYQPKLCSFAIMPSKSLICTGGNSKAMLWDIRKNQDKLKPEPVAELDGHTGPVTHLHMDSNKIVTGGPDDVCTNVWEADTGRLTNSLLCYFPGEASVGGGCTSMAVSGSRIVTASSNILEENGLLRYRDFSNASCPVLSSEDKHDSKFWNPQSYNDSDSSDC